MVQARCRMRDDEANNVEDGGGAPQTATQSAAMELADRQRQTQNPARGKGEGSWDLGERMSEEWGTSCALL